MYLYDLNRLKNHVNYKVQALPPSCQMFYAIKANSKKTILKALLPLVHGFEVASLGEIKKVREVSSDVPIIFGGPGKTNQEIEGAIDHKISLIHVESINELQRIAAIANKRKVKVPILLRVNSHVTLPGATFAMAGRPTQFGIDESQIPEVIELAQPLESIQVQGFHFHSLSKNLNVEQHVRLVEHYCEEVTKWSREYGLNITFLNVGGGIGVNYADLTRTIRLGSICHTFEYYVTS